MDARVIVSEETIKKAGKISNRRKGELRLAKLKQLAKSGELQKAKIRFDVAEMCGYTQKQRSAGYAWVGYLIKRGVLNERLVGRNPKNNWAEYEFSLATTPKTKPATVADTAPLFEEKATSTVITIKHGDTAIVIEGAQGADILEIVKTVIK